jgi:hypothetical protein
VLSCLIWPQNINLSVVEFHNNPKVFITSLFQRLNNNFLSSSSGKCSSNAWWFDEHFVRSNPPFFNKPIKSCCRDSAQHLHHLLP